MNTKYQIKQARNKNQVREKEYFCVDIDSYLTFPSIDSCIGIMYIKNKKMLGIHLVLTDSKNQILGSPDSATPQDLQESINAVLVSNLKCLIASCEKCYVIGEATGEWLPYLPELVRQDECEFGDPDQKGDITVKYNGEDFVLNA